MNRQLSHQHVFSFAQSHNAPLSNGAMVKRGWDSHLRRVIQIIFYENHSAKACHLACHTWLTQNNNAVPSPAPLHQVALLASLAVPQLEISFKHTPLYVSQSSCPPLIGMTQHGVFRNSYPVSDLLCHRPAWVRSLSYLMPRDGGAGQERLFPPQKMGSTRSKSALSTKSTEPGILRCHDRNTLLAKRTRVIDHRWKGYRLEKDTRAAV